MGSIDRYDISSVLKITGQGFMFGSILGAVRYFKSAGSAPDAGAKIPSSVHIQQASSSALKGSLVFGSIAGVYAATSIFLAEQRNKKDVYNHAAGGALSGIVASGVLGDFSFKGIMKRVLGLAICTALYSRAIKIEDYGAEYKAKHGQEMPSGVAWSILFSSEEDL